MGNENIELVIDFYNNNKHRLQQFQASVETFFLTHPQLNAKPFPIIHSVKTRLKDPDHLKDKIERKLKKGIKITKDNLFREITDLIGLRVLHLYQDQFPLIHNEILKYINEGDWIFVEEPKAMTWDPESKLMYDNLKIETELRETYYTSVHYVIKPNNNNPNPLCCEIQVRTLFEEIWGEIDHSINYPHPTDDIACKEQLRVLSKLVSTGTRLADSIFRTLNDHKEKRFIIQAPHKNHKEKQIEEIFPGKWLNQYQFEDGRKGEEVLEIRNGNEYHSLGKHLFNLEFVEINEENGTIKFTKNGVGSDARKVNNLLRIINENHYEGEEADGTIIKYTRIE